MEFKHLPPKIKAEITRQFGRDDDIIDGINPGRDAAIKIACMSWEAAQEKFASLM